MSGTIPPEVGGLSQLRYLYLNNNRLSGSIPVELGRLSRLTNLFLADNQLTGCVPPALRNVNRNDLASLGLPDCGAPGPLTLPEVDDFSAVVGQPFTATLPEASGGTLPYRYTATGLPAGLAFATSTQRTFRIAVAPSPCANGTTVPDPASNSGLVSDCEALLAAKDALRGTASLNWSGSLAITSWDGVTVGGSPRRVRELDLGGRGLNGTVPGLSTLAQQPP